MVKNTNMTPFYTSRSAVETYQRCPRKRFLQYHYNATGIVPTTKSVPLSTGTCIHAGIEHLLYRMVSIAPELVNYETLQWREEIDAAVIVATKSYIDLVRDSGFHGVGVERTEQQEYTFQEQIALTEALVRVWAIVEAPLLIERFRVVGVEKEITCELDGPTNHENEQAIIFQARVDGELQSRADGAYYNYSLKTTKGWDDRSEKTYKKDLQGITEIYTVEQQPEQINQSIRYLLEEVDNLYDLERMKQLLEVKSFLEKRIKPAKRVMGVKFCFLVKGWFGPTIKGDKDSLYNTKNDLIRGWRNITPTGVEYAISEWYRNPDNKSGWGKLGKGWERFDCWTDKKFQVRNWIDKIYREQSEKLKEYCITPVEYFRDDKEIQEAMGQVIDQECRIRYMLNPHSDTNGGGKNFPKYRSSCHYPTDCEYNPICWPNEFPTLGDVGADPLESGLYQIRAPHHKKEKESFEKR